MAHFTGGKLLAPWSSNREETQKDTIDRGSAGEMESQSKEISHWEKKMEIVEPCFHFGSEKKRDETEQIRLKFRGGKTKIWETEKRRKVNEGKEGKLKEENERLKSNEKERHYYFLIWSNKQSEQS